MQPYQEAGEAIAKRKQAPINAIRTAGTIIGGGAALRGSGAVLKRILPFLNDYIPESIARKGLEKVDPRLGKFINHMTDAGNTFTDVKDILKLKAEGAMALQAQNKNKTQESVNQPAKQHLNIVEQYSPELHQLISNEIKKGRTPTQAAAGLQASKQINRFKDAIQKMEKDHKTDLLSIIEATYGNPQMAQPQPQQQEQILNSKGFTPEQVQQREQQRQGGQGQSGQDFKQMTAAALQKIMSM